MKYLLLLFTISANLTTYARKIDGYIVLQNTDTVKCEVVQNFAVISGIDIASFQYGIRVVFDNGKKSNFMPADIKGFGLYIKNDTLHFVSVRVLTSNFFRGTEEKQVFMRIIQRGHIKIYYFVDLINGPNGPVRTPVYAVQLAYNDPAYWLEAKKNEFGKYDFKSFFKGFIPEYYAFFESLPDKARLEEALDRIRKFNRAMVK